VIVATLGLNGFDDDSRDGIVVGLDDLLCFSEASLLLGGVLLHVLSSLRLTKGRVLLLPGHEMPGV